MSISALDFWSPDSEFVVEGSNFTHLEVRRAAETDSFHYFYDRATSRLIKHFLLHEGPRVALLCQVRLISRGEKYTPRLRLWKKDKTTRRTAEASVRLTEQNRVFKASVDTSDGHENFWRLICFLQGLDEVDASAHDGQYRFLPTDQAQLIEILGSQDRTSLLRALGTALAGQISEQELSILAGRKATVEHFDRLLHEPDFFESEKERLGKRGEALWQKFFEESTWIFGYGLSMVAHESIDDGKLERITTGANIFSGGGKRIDAIMRTRAAISGLLFCEIKRHDTGLLHDTRYREPDVYRASNELIGGVAQLQKTVRKAYRLLIKQVETLTEEDGSPTGLDFSTTKARQVLVVGNLDEFRTTGGVNGEKMESFGLYRKSLADVEVITFDELYERARFIIG